jgi:integrase
VIKRTDASGHWRAGSLAYQWKAVQLAFTTRLPEGHWIRERVRWAADHSEQGGHFTWHELRQTGATQFLLAGVSREAVARQLGHATAEHVLETYGHVYEWDAAQEFQASTSSR